MIPLHPLSKSTPTGRKPGDNTQNKMKTYLTKTGSAANGHNNIGSGYDVTIVREDDDTAIALIRHLPTKSNEIAELSIDEDTDLDGLAHEIAQCPSAYFSGDPDVMSEEDEGYDALAERFDAVIEAAEAPLWQQLKDAIEDEAEDYAISIAKTIHKTDATEEVVETAEDENEDAGTIYKTVTRQLLIDGEEVAEWTICAQGWYVRRQGGNPMYHVGWNVAENTDGNDGISDGSVLDEVLKIFDLDKEAKEVPGIAEPAAAEKCDEENAEYCVMVRNTYTQGMEEFEPLTYHATREAAEKAMAESERKFAAANSANSYGPEWTIGTKDESGVWTAEETDEE